jgi:hypothetical protein
MDEKLSTKREEEVISYNDFRKKFYPEVDDERSSISLSSIANRASASDLGIYRAARSVFQSSSAKIK